RPDERSVRLPRAEQHARSIPDILDDAAPVRLALSFRERRQVSDGRPRINRILEQTDECANFASRLIDTKHLDHHRSHRLLRSRAHEELLEVRRRDRRVWAGGRLPPTGGVGPLRPVRSAKRCASGERVTEPVAWPPPPGPHPAPPSDKTTKCLRMSKKASEWDG